MEKLKISIINGIEIIAVKNENNKVFVPIKPMCEALGISFPSQRTQINDHPILASTVLLCNTVGADGKEREMFCLPYTEAHGWLLTISPKNVSESSREKLITYLRECYEVISNYFDLPLQKRQEADRKEKELTDQITEIKAREKELRSARIKAEAELQKHRDSRLKDIP